MHIRCTVVHQVPAKSVKSISIFSEHSTYHRVILSKSNLITALGDRLSSGQRIYVNGSLRYFDFIGNDEKKKRTGYILPNQIRICEQNVGDDDQLRALSDVNEVKLFGRVLHKARSTDNCTFLDMITHFFDRYEYLLLVIPISFSNGFHIFTSFTGVYSSIGRTCIS